MGQSMSTDYVADVLVIGGGPAGAWAAWSAAASGARVVLADKGYLGTSGATAPGGTNLLVVPPHPDQREAAVLDRVTTGGYLSEPSWVHRVLDQVYHNLELIAKWGYDFPKDEHGNVVKTHLHGPNYMQIMRKVVAKAGVKILDQSPAQELLVDGNGVGGARGINRLTGREWEVKANAVVLATGGCAFLSKGLGCNVLTGDGLLMASELGADLSGMEFSRHYAPSAAFGTVTRGRLLGWANYYDKDGNLLTEGGPRGDGFLARMLQKGPVYAVLEHADTEEKRRILRHSHPIFFLPYERQGIDVFTQKFPLTMRYEGTVRGTGGIRLVGEDCSTSVAGLYAAGDAASREKVTGGRSGGGALNASWAISSGTWSGKGAAAYAAAHGLEASSRQRRPAPRYGLTSAAESSETIDNKAIVEAVQKEILPMDMNYFRSEPVIQASLERLHGLWPLMRGRAPEDIRGRVRAREAAALVAAARWIYASSLARRETRGMHTLAEYPELDPAQTHRILVSGLDEIRLRTEAVAELDRSLLQAGPSGGEKGVRIG
jgi:succinate dehydrogenase/fumarate reductase flavoprotein subunit